MTDYVDKGPLKYESDMKNDRKTNQKNYHKTHNSDNQHHYHLMCLFVEGCAIPFVSLSASIGVYQRHSSPY